MIKRPSGQGGAAAGHPGRRPVRADRGHRRGRDAGRAADRRAVPRATRRCWRGCAPSCSRSGNGPPGETGATAADAAGRARASPSGPCGRPARRRARRASCWARCCDCCAAGRSESASSMRITLTRPEWLLDGWGQVCGLWESVARDERSVQRETLQQIRASLPMLDPSDREAGASLDRQRHPLRPRAPGQAARGLAHGAHGDGEPRPRRAAAGGNGMSADRVLPASRPRHVGRQRRAAAAGGRPDRHAGPARPGRPAAGARARPAGAAAAAAPDHARPGPDPAVRGSAGRGRRGVAGPALLLARHTWRWLVEQVAASAARRRPRTGCAPAPKATA